MVISQPLEGKIMKFGVGKIYNLEAHNVTIIYDDSVESVTFYRQPGPHKAYVIDHEKGGKSHLVRLSNVDELKRLRDAIDKVIKFE